MLLGIARPTGLPTRWFWVSQDQLDYQPDGSGYRKTNWMYGCGHSQVQVDQNPVVVGTRKSKWIRIPWLWVLASSTPMLLTRRIRWLWVLARSTGCMVVGTRKSKWIRIPWFWILADGSEYSQVQLDQYPHASGHSLLLLWRPETEASSAVGLQVAYGPLWHSTEP
jgi:hypothetical protein